MRRRVLSLSLAAVVVAMSAAVSGGVAVGQGEVREDLVVNGERVQPPSGWQAPRKIEFGEPRAHGGAQVQSSIRSWSTEDQIAYLESLDQPPLTAQVPARGPVPDKAVDERVVDERVDVDRGVEITVPPVVGTATGVAASTTDGTIRPAALTYDGTTPSSAVGKLFMLEGDTVRSLCSAAVVVANNRSTVMTAAHCLDTPGIDAVAFVPRYDYGTAPLGVWWLAAAFTSSCYTDVETACDWAFGVAHFNNGVPIQDVTGANGISFGYENVWQVEMHLYGYPARPTWVGLGGEYQVRCADLVDTVQVWQNRYHYSDCLMGPGASGGPWLAAFDSTTRLGIIGGINSFMFCPDPSCENPDTGIHTSRLRSHTASDYASVQNLYP